VNRRDFLASSLLLAAGTALPGCAGAVARPQASGSPADPPRAPRRPNVVFVIADDTTPSYHGCYGGPTPTPHIDALAADGLRMTRGFCCASLCSPSRYTLFTGLYTQRSPANLRKGLPSDPATVSQTGELTTGQTTLASVLRAQGYLTGHFGKWHSRFDMGDLGHEPLRHPIGDADDPQIEAALRRNHDIARDVIQRSAGFEVADRIFWGNLDAKKGADPRLTHHNPAWITDGALDFIDRAHREGRPFYLHVANTVPHTPDCHLSLGQDHRYTWNGRLDQPPRSHPDDASVLARMRAANLPTEGPFAGVNAGQMMIDDQLGAIIARLAELGQLDDTLFVYTADHGLSGKGSCHAIGQHMPLVMRWAAGGLRGGRLVADPFSWVHVAPTIAAACGAAWPQAAPLDGVSLLESLHGQAPWPAAARIAYHEMGWSRSVVKGRYHYIATRYPAEALARLQAGDASVAGTGIETFDRLNATFFPHYFAADQLYDLDLDPLELTNLIDDRTRAAVLADLRQELERICATLPRPFPSEAHPFQRSAEYRQRVVERHAELAKIQHYPRQAAHIPTVVCGNYDDPDLPRP